MTESRRVILANIRRRLEIMREEAQMIYLDLKSLRDEEAAEQNELSECFHMLDDAIYCMDSWEGIEADIVKALQSGEGRCENE